MGSNQSKPMKSDPERAEKENHIPASSNRSTAKKRKVNDVVCFVDESFKDKENLNSLELVQNQPSVSTGNSAAVGMKDYVRERKQSSTLSADVSDNSSGHSGAEKTRVRRKSNKPDNFKTLVHNPKVETDKVSDVDKKDQEEDSTCKMNDVVTDAACFHVAIQSPNSAFSPAQTSECKHSTVNDSNDRVENGTRKHIARDTDEDVGESRKRPSESSLLATAPHAESESHTKSELQTKSSSELPEPYLMQQVSTVDSLYTSGISSSLSSLSTNSPVQSNSHTSDPSLFSNGVIASSSSSLFRPAIHAQPSLSANAFGNFSYSGNMVSSVITSTSPCYTNNSTSLLSTDGMSYGNFSMNSSPFVADSSSNVSNGSLRASISPSNSQFDFTQRFRHSPNVYDSQTGIPAGSSTNFLSGVTTSNSITRHSNNESPNSSSATSLSFDTGTVSNRSVYLTNYSNYILRNWNGLANDVETDSLDLFDDETIAQQLSEYLPSYNDSRDTNNFDDNFITIRTSVGDTISKISSKNITLNSNYVGNDLTDENMGIILERPKYPRYATLASREKSFENVWPVTNKMSWKKLPEAGFVYTGTADCVRCYYCNGGLREWLKNDCPWIEHARYYPHCPHVRQCKGDEFVRRVREGTNGGTSAQDGGSGDEMEVDNETAGTSLGRDQEAMEIAAEIISDQTLLEKAAYYIKNIQGKSSFDAQELAAIAFEIEDGTITFNFEDALEDDTTCIVDEVLAESSDSEEEIEIDGLMLEEENRMLRERSLCKVCLDATACVLFLDCGHMIACPMCAPALKTCAVCRAEVKGTVRAIYATDR